MEIEGETVMRIRITTYASYSAVSEFMYVLKSLSHFERRVCGRRVALSDGDR